MIILCTRRAYYLIKIVFLTGVDAPFAKQTLGRELLGAAQLSDDEKLSHDDDATATIT